ncbi:MAG: ATP synthase F0 subunit B [Acidobacteria bacterium]|nr:ATP synthase F0 subunit B [Acidobacteriota bacterium]MCB9396399.1 ATP synthase F0 subunit B [Acidobacteriota bacterium]
MNKFRLLFLCFVCVLPVLASGGEAGEAAHHGIEWMKLLQQAFNTVLFFGLIFYLIRKPAAEFFSGRLRHIKESLEMAEKSRQEAKSRLAEIESKMQNLESELKQIEEQAHLDAEREKERIQEAAQKDVERILQQAREEVEFRKRRAITELKQFAVELSFQHAEADLQKQLDAGTRQRLREDFVHSMEAKL